MRAMNRVIALLILSMLSFQVFGDEGIFGKRVRFEESSDLNVSGVKVRFVGKSKENACDTAKSVFVMSDGQYSADVNYFHGCEVTVQEFTLGENKYVLEVGESLIFPSLLQKNELIIWQFKEWSQRYNLLIEKQNGKNS